MTNETLTHIATVVPIDSEALKPDSTRQRNGSIIKDFALNTSTHGIPGIARSRTIPNLIFWSVATFCSTGIMLYFVIQSIRAYFNYPTQTSVAIVVEWPQAFPAVTICNYSPLRNDTFMNPFLKYTNTTTFNATQAMYIRDFLNYKINNNESLTEFFFPLSSMLMDCNYNGMACSAVNFTSFTSPLYGICYTFNAKLKNAANDGIRYNADNGRNGLLRLSLYVHRHQYIPYMTNATGMVVMVHDNAQLPYIEAAAMQLAPGRHHKLGYTKKTTSFLPYPYTTCTDNVNPGMQAMFDQFHGTDYGYQEFICYTVCIQAYTYKKCGCGNPFRWTGRSIILPGSDTAVIAPLCNLTDPCYTTAATEIMNTQSIWTTFCPDCTQECSSVDFTIKLSSLAAPPDFLLGDIKNFVESSTITLPTNWSTIWSTEIPASYMSVEVAYETTQSEVISQQATLGPVDVISNVGGQTGLWIGISFLSLMEIAEMIYRLIHYQCHRVRHGVLKRVKKQETYE